MTATLVKIYFGEEVRRLTLEDRDLSVKAIKEKVHQLFSIENEEKWVLKWKDEDGDLVTLSEDYELVDALHQKNEESETKVFKLWISLKKKQPFSDNQHQHQFHHQHQHQYHHQQTPIIAEKVVGTIFDVISSLSSTFLVQPQQQQRCQQQQQQQRCQQNYELNDGHYRARCDVTGKCLSINNEKNSKWFHKPETMQDLCEEEWVKLSTEQKSIWIEVKKADDLGNQKQRYQIKRGGGRSRCPYFQQQQQHQNGSNDESLVVNAICDETGIKLFAGKGWYHLRGSNYDICEGFFSQLPSEQQVLYTKIEKLEDLNEEYNRYCSPFIWRHFSQKQSQQQSQQKQEDEEEEKEEQQKNQKIKIEYSFTASDATLPSGPVVQSGSIISPTWEIKNTSEVVNISQPSSWQGVKLRACSPNPFKFNKEIDVLPLSVGQTGVVGIELIAPEVETPTFVFAEFELINSTNGEAFGDKLRLKLAVEPKKLPEIENESELLTQLENAGFTDKEACIFALRENKGNINAAALSLLRANK